MPGITIPRRTWEGTAYKGATPPRRVALFTGAYNHIADGVSLTLNRLVSYLENQGVEVLVFAPTVDRPPIEHAGTLIPIPSFALPGRADYQVSLGLSRTARKALRAFKPTLFHVATPDLLGLHAMRMAHLWKVPVVSSYHTHFSSYLKYYDIQWLDRTLWKYLRWYYGRCEHVYVPSPTMAQVLGTHGITKGLHPWPRGVDTSRFSPDRHAPAWRHALGIGDDEVVISFISRLVWEKGPDIFAEIIEDLRARGIPHRSLIVGDGPARAELETRLPETIFTGYLKGEALARAYASSDLFVFPSETETFGNVTLEAMASGLAAVCADAPGSNTLVEHGKTGFLVPPGDTAAFSDYVAQLVTDTPLRRTMGRAARQRAQHYEWDAVMARMLGYYDEILDPHHAVSGDGAGNHPSTTAWPCTPPLLVSRS